MPKEISYKELQEKFPIPSGSFNRAVQERIIKKTRRGYYDLNSVVEYYRERHPLPPTAPPSFDWLTIFDLGSLYSLEYEKYGADTGDPKVVATWVRKNPYIGRIAFNPENRQELWGAVIFLPIVTQDVVIKLVAHRMRDVELDARTQILDYVSGRYDLYCASVIMREDKRHLLFDLLKNYFSWWVEQAPNRTIGKIWGRAVSDEGEMLAIRLQMSPIDDLPGRVYRLDLSRPNAHKLIKQYQKLVLDKSKN